MAHKHLTQSEREFIALRLAKGHNLKEIAIALKRHPSTIGRELRRNQQEDDYLPVTAHELACNRKRGKPPVKMNTLELSRLVKSCLRRGWSPEQISGRLRLQKSELQISHESIYRWLNREALRGRLWQRYLRRKGKRYRYGNTALNRRFDGRTGIEERPQIVDTRLRLGDWEADTLEGCKGGMAVASLLERKSRFCLLAPLKERSAAAFYDAAASRFKYNRKLPRQTLTVDNGGEFACHRELQKSLKMDVYFARPYHPEDKGEVENLNGLLREYLPKGFRKASPQQIAEIESRLNNRPRKCLGYRTPAEVLFGS
jgi:IS30 family transposase